MFGLYMLAIYLGVAVIAAGFVALLVVVALAVGLVTHPIRTLALVFHKLAALAAGLALILALIAWFWTDHAKPDFIPCFWGSIGVIVASIIIRAVAEWILERPTRAERRAMKRATIAQGAGRVTMRMPVSEEVAAAFEHGRAGQHRPWRRRNRPQGHDHVPDGRGPQSRTQTILCGQRHENGRDHQPSHRTMASNQMNIRFYINKYSATFSVYLA